MDTTIKWIFTFWFLVSYWFRSWLNILKNHEKSKDIVWISCMKFVTIIGLLECHIWETNILRTSLDLQNNFGNGLWNSFQKCRVTFESNFWHGHFFFFFLIFSKGNHFPWIFVESKFSRIRTNIGIDNRTLMMTLSRWNAYCLLFYANE